MFVGWWFAYSGGLVVGSIVAQLPGCVVGSPVWFVGRLTDSLHSWFARLLGRYLRIVLDFMPAEARSNGEDKVMNRCAYKVCGNPI